MRYRNLKKKSIAKSYWKKALAMFFVLVFVAAVAIFAYDSPDGEYGYWFYTYEEGYLSDAPYWDNYYVYNEAGVYYEEGGYIGVAPEYHNHTISIEVDFYGNVTAAPYYMAYDIERYGAGFWVTFDSNGGLPMQPGHQARDTLDCGTLRYAHRMPTVPLWPGGGRIVVGWNTESDLSGENFTHETVIDQDITVYAVWGFWVHFWGNGIVLANYGDPSSPTCYSTRGIPTADVNWSFDDTPWFVFPDPPNRPGFNFLGWFNTSAAEGGTEYTSSTPISGETNLHARWEMLRWLVTFDPAGGVMQSGSSGNPQRNYRWALDTLCVRRSGTAVAASGGIIPLLPEHRQNQSRLWNPTVSRPHLDYTPFYVSSGTSIVNPVPTGVNAATAWPLSAPNVLWPVTWQPSTATGHPAHATVPVLTLGGWWENPGGWESNDLIPAFPAGGPAAAPLANHRWALPGTVNANTTTAIVYPSGFASRPVTGDITVYAHYVIRLTFNPNQGFAGQQGFAIAGNANFSPGNSATANFRDFVPGGPRTIADGRRVRQNDSGLVAHEGSPVAAGMPPVGNMTKPGHEFNGWWCTSIAASSNANAPTLADARQFTETSVIGCPCSLGSACQHYPWKGSRQVWAHWTIAALDGATIIFDLNVNQTGDGHGEAFWPTHRPLSLDGQLTDRFFLPRVENAYFDIPAPFHPEIASNNSQVARLLPAGAAGNLVFANTNYNNRYDMQLIRHYPAGLTIVQVIPDIQRMPRNPMRPGYVFMGWFDNPEGMGMPFNPYTDVLTAGIKVLYALWVPSFDLIFNMNDGTGREVVRNMPLTQLEPFFLPVSINDMGNFGWRSDTGPDSAGQSHMQNMYILATISQVFGRSGFTRLTALNNSFNFHSNPTPGTSTSRRFFDSTMIQQFDLNQYGGIDPATGRSYIRLYQQWGGTLTFNANFNHPTSGIGSGFPVTTRTALIAEGQSMNDVLDATLRHPHQGTRQLVFTSAAWPGTTGIDGTRGGWPTYTPATPVGGHWPQMFQLAGSAWNLLEWNTHADGSGQTVDVNTPIYGDTTFWAIWGQYIVFHPGLAGDEAQNMPIPLRRPVDVSLNAPLDNFPTPPVWPGRIFRGWHVNGDPTLPELAYNTNVVAARTYHAVWYAYVVWHPALTPNSGANIPGYAANIPSDPRRVIVGNVFGDVGPADPVRGGGWILGRCPTTNVVNWFAEDANAPNGRRMYNRNSPPIYQGVHLFPEWLGNVHFLPNGGLINNSTATVTRTVLESFTLAINPAAQRVPTSITSDTAQFIGWRQVDANGEAINPGAALLTAAEIEAIAVTEPHLWFEAVWIRHFDFIKVNDGYYIDGAEPTPLPGAVFRLWRQEDNDAGGYTWEPVVINPGAVSPASVYELASAPTTGLVELQFSMDTVYRLREIYAPQPYRLPPEGHYWEIVLDASDIVSITRIHLDPALIYQIPEFRWLPVATEDEYVLHLANIRDTRFRFHKTNDGLYTQQSHPDYPWQFLLPGGHFRLFRFVGINLGADELVMLNTNGTIADPSRWAEVTYSLNRNVSTGLQGVGQYIAYDIDRRYTYQLVEALAPAGFQPPWGQWRIHVGRTPSPAPNDLEFLVTSIADNGQMPPMFLSRVHMSPSDVTSISDYWFIGNIQQFQLPLTGGIGISMFITAGGVILTAAVLAMATLMLKKKLAVKPAPVSNRYHRPL